MLEPPNVNQLVQLFKSKNIAAQQKFIQECPDSFAKESAIAVARREEPGLTLSALNLLAMSYVNSNSEWGKIIGKACYLLSQEYFNKYSSITDKNNFLFLAGQGVHTCILSLEQQGKHQQLLNLLTAAIPWLEQAGETNNLPFLRVYYIKTKIYLQQYDEAKQLLEQEKAQQLVVIEQLKNQGLKEQLSQARLDFLTLQNLEQQLSEIMQPADNLREQQPTEEQVIKRNRQYILDNLDAFVQGWDQSSANFGEEQQPTEEQVIKRNRQYILDNLDALVQGWDETPANFEEMKQLLERKLAEATDYKKLGPTLVDLINKFNQLLNPKGELNQREVERQINNATAIFIDDTTGRDREHLENSLAILKQARDWTKANNFSDNESDALWGMYLCYSRLNQPDKTVEVLQALRDNIETVREHITNPHNRAGIMAKYPYLFPALCQFLCRLNRSEELLTAIEGAKGRVLADVLTQLENQPVSERQFSQSARLLPSLMQQLQAHYLTYFVDEEETYAVLVAKNGSVYSQEITIGKKQIQLWLEYKNSKHDPLNPENWGKTINARLKSKVPNLSETLAPLVSWLEPLAAQNIIQPNDHICYCPDEQLHLIPLHYLKFRGEYLVNYVSVSRIQGALALTKLLERENLQPHQFAVVKVWAKTDLGNQESEKMIPAFHQVGEWLNQQLPGEIVAEGNADLPTIAKLNFQHKIVHFSTHGVFPSLMKQEPSQINPFSNSGLLLKMVKYHLVVVKTAMMLIYSHPNRY